MKCTILMWLLPFALLGSSACGMFFAGDCRDLEPIAFEDAVYETESWEAGQSGASGVHATGGPKTLTVDAATDLVIIEYVDTDGAARVETWAMTVNPQQTFE